MNWIKLREIITAWSDQQAARTLTLAFETNYILFYQLIKFKTQLLRAVNCSFRGMVENYQTLSKKWQHIKSITQSNTI